MLNIIMAAPSGNWKGNVEAVVTPDDMQYIRALIQSSPYLRHDSDSIHSGRGCPALKEVIYITPFGDVLTCPFIHVSMGNLHDESLQEIRSRGLKYHFLKKHSKQCLVAQENNFIKKYISQTFGRTDLPLHHTEVFGSPEKAKVDYLLVTKGVELRASVDELVQEWRSKVGKTVKNDFFEMTHDAHQIRREQRINVVSQAPKG